MDKIGENNIQQEEKDANSKLSEIMTVLQNQIQINNRQDIYLN
jgi:hypothetical protein